MSELELGFGKGVDVDRVVAAWKEIERELSQINERLARLERLVREIALGLGIRP